jgi:excisionase family DNA binding protein
MTRLFSVPEAAARFEVTSQTVRNWIITGRLPALQTARRGRYRITQEDLESLENAMSTANRDRQSSDSLAPRLVLGGSDWRAELDQVVHAIVAAVAPDAVYLFGSRARGDAKSESDFDLAVVVPNGSQRRQIAMRSYESLASVPRRTVGVEVVVLTPQIIATERELVGSISRSIVREGVMVYGSAVI